MFLNDNYITLQEFDYIYVSVIRNQEITKKISDQMINHIHDMIKMINENTITYQLCVIIAYSTK